MSYSLKEHRGHDTHNQFQMNNSKLDNESSEGNYPAEAAAADSTQGRGTRDTRRCPESTRCHHPLCWEKRGRWDKTAGNTDDEERLFCGTLPTFKGQFHEHKWVGMGEQWLSCRWTDEERVWGKRRSSVAGKKPTHTHTHTAQESPPAFLFLFLSSCCFRRSSWTAQLSLRCPRGERLKGKVASSRGSFS